MKNIRYIHIYIYIYSRKNIIYIYIYIFIEKILYIIYIYIYIYILGKVRCFSDIKKTDEDYPAVKRERERERDRERERERETETERERERDRDRERNYKKYRRNKIVNFKRIDTSRNELKPKISKKVIGISIISGLHQVKACLLCN